MKLLAFSDIHGNNKAFEKIKESAKGLDGIIFAGDGIGCFNGQSLDMPVYKVCGNCDYDMASSELVIQLDGVKAFITHGHLYGAKYGNTKLYYRAKELGCSLVVFGHNHHAEVTEYDGITFVNPGTCKNYCAQKTFALIFIKDGKVNAFIDSVTLADC